MPVDQPVRSFQTQRGLNTESRFAFVGVPVVPYAFLGVTLPEGETVVIMTVEDLQKVLDG